jgi:hypothetical protein
MPRPKRPTKARLNLETSVAVRARLESLRDRTDADSLAEVVRRALAVYEFAHKEQAAGGVLYFQSAEGQISRVVIL